jgi:alkylation response protein AidB-like acyl-CoA dehydrogenase
VDRTQLDAPQCRPQHGLDELAAFTVRDLAPTGAASPLDDLTARRVLAHALTLDWLGLLAIAVGALERGQQLAVAFASIRQQGGVLIARHPAVQRMLSDIEGARRQADLTLTSFSAAIGDIDLGAVASARATLHPMLCDAANQVVQVHGGIGYMSDAGPEKILRDLNVLTLQAGGVLAAHAFVAGWAEASP